MYRRKEINSRDNRPTLARTITDVGLENQGVGLDTANLITYDKGHPVCAFDV